MPWEKTYQVDDVLDRAVIAFWKTGYEGTSMADLVNATGLNRGSIYSAFSDKRSLFLSSLKHYNNNFCATLLMELREDNPPREAILALFEAAAEGGKGLPGGCLLVNTSLEMAPHDDEIAKYIQGAIGEVEAFFRDCLVEARAEGAVRKDINPERTAHTLLGLMIGVRVLTRAKPHRAAIVSILAQVRDLMK